MCIRDRHGSDGDAGTSRSTTGATGGAGGAGASDPRYGSFYGSCGRGGSGGRGATRTLGRTTSIELFGLQPGDTIRIVVGPGGAGGSGGPGGDGRSSSFRPGVGVPLAVSSDGRQGNLGATGSPGSVSIVANP